MIAVRSRVIEVGCGDGWNVGKLVEAGCKNVVGIDWSKNGIDHAKRMVPTAQFYCGNLTDSEFMDQFPDLFDAAILVEVLEHIPPQECVQALQNMIQFIRPGGTFVLTTPSTNYPNDNPYHYRHFTEPVLQELIEEVGNLDIISLEGYGDYNALQQMWMLRRWVDNRYYCIYGLKYWLAKQFAKKCHNPPLDRCMGFIVVMRKRG